MRNPDASLPRLAALLAATLCACADDEPDARGPREPRGTMLAPTPPMGWSSWNAFGCDIDALRIEEQAQAMVDLGLRELGYLYVNIDDCWMAKERAADGAP